MNAVSAIPLEQFEARQARQTKAFPLLQVGTTPPSLGGDTHIAGTWGARTVAGLIGPYSGGKTACAVDMVCCIGTGTPWHGLRVTQSPFLYHAGEGIAALDNRFHAWKIRHQMQDATIPGAIIKAPGADYRKPEFVDQIIATIQQAGDLFEQPVGVLVIDTLNATAGGADENSAADMATYVASLQRIIAETGVGILLLHHMGKSVERGARGSTAIPAAFDSEFRTERMDGSNAIELRVSKQRDLGDGQAYFYTLEGEELGVNEHGESITAVVACQMQQGTGPARKRRPTGQAGIVYDALIEAMTDAPREAPASIHIPAGRSVVSEALWRDYAYKRLPDDAKPDSKRKAFKRAAESMIAAGLIGKWGDDVWVA